MFCKPSVVGSIRQLAPASGLTVFSRVSPPAYSRAPLGVFIAIFKGYSGADVLCMICNTTLKHDAKRHGFTLVEIMIVAAILGLLASIAIPHFLRHREFANRNSCIENLRQIAAAKAVWAQEKNKGNSHTPVESDLFGATNYIREKPRCPSGGADYVTTIGTVGEPPKCSFGVTSGHVLTQ